jgi:hypothetical protein
MGFVEKELLLNIARKRKRTHATKMLGMPKNVECYQHDNTIEQNRGCTRTRPHGHKPTTKLSCVLPLKVHGTLQHS